MTTNHNEANEAHPQEAAPGTSGAGEEGKVLTEAEIAEIEARWKAATPGPWVEVSGDDEYCSNIYGVLGQTEYERVKAGRVNETGEIQHRGDFPEDTAWIFVDPGVAPVMPPNENDYNFLFHSHADVPALISTLRHTQADRDAAWERASAEARRHLEHNEEWEERLETARRGAANLQGALEEEHATRLELEAELAQARADLGALRGAASEVAKELGRMPMCDCGGLVAHGKLGIAEQRLRTALAQTAVPAPEHGQVPTFPLYLDGHRHDGEADGPHCAFCGLCGWVEPMVDGGYRHANVSDCGSAVQEELLNAWVRHGRAYAKEPEQQAAEGAVEGVGD